MSRNIKSNLWKFFLYEVSQRRHFIPILSIFFMTLPDSTAQQIGFYGAAGFIAAFFLEIPSGYFSDKFGHKNTLILAKALMILSMLSFIFANSLYYFIAGSLFLSLSIAFASGTKDVFMHETLVAIGKEKDYTKIMSKIKANVSIVSMVLIVLLPFLTTIDILLPLKVNLIFDILGLIVAFSFISPSRELSSEHYNAKAVFDILKKLRGTGFYATSLFIGALTGFLMTSTQYKYVYLQSLGYPVILIGLVMGLSRIIWFFIGHNIHKIENKIKIKSLFKFELLLFPLSFILVSIFSNPYVVGFLFALFNGYFWGRNQLIINHFLTNYMVNENYKATILSIKNQADYIFQAVIVLSIGFIMNTSFKSGFLVMGVSLFLILALLYPKIK